MKRTRRIRPTRSKFWRRDIERRVEGLESAIVELGLGLDIAEDAIERYHPQRPPTTEPPPGGEWPGVPDIYVGLTPRGGEIEEYIAGSAPDWTTGGAYRHSTAYAERADLAVYVWREQWQGYDATRTTIAVVNGFANRGTAYLDGIQFEVAGEATFTLGGQNCILPRGTFLRRFHTGPDSDKLIRWEHIEPNGPTLPWIPALCEQGRQRSILSALPVGPYMIGDPGVVGNGSLAGSHGGWRIAPYWGDEDGWQTTCSEGLRWMGEDWLYTAARSPIALLKRGTGQWLNPHAPYWPGSTVQHEPPGYEVADVPAGGGQWQWRQLDGWCPYEAQLRLYRAHDHTHGSRGYRAAAAVAKHDIAARWFLVQLWGNYAAWLDGAPSTNGLLQHLPQMRLTPEHVGDSRGGRGWAHTLGCFLAAEPWIADRPSWGGTWREALTGLTEHWAIPTNGWTHSTQKEGFPLPDKTLEDGSPNPAWVNSGWPELEDPVGASRELDLVGVNLKRLGLDWLDAAWRRSLVPLSLTGGWRSVGEHLEIRPVRHWSSVNYRNPNAQPQYDLFRGEWARFGGLAAVMAQAEGGSPNEMLLGNVRTSAWQGAI